MARTLPPSEIGTFGLIVGATSIAPAVIGCGLNYTLNREIVGLPPALAMHRLRDRLVPTLALAVLLPLLGFVAMLGRPIPPSALLAIPVVALECLSVDIYLNLVSLRRVLLANAFLFIRSAAWIPLAVAAALLDPALRNVEWLLAFWLGGLVAGFVVLGFVFGWRSLAATAALPIDRAWLRHGFARARLIYPNDIALVGMVVFDRYLVDHFLDRAAAGAFFLVWSLANAVQVLATAAFIQPALPDLIEAYRGEPASAPRVLARETGRMMLDAGVVAIILFATMPLVFPAIGQGGGAFPRLLFATMLAGTLLRLVADMLNLGLYAEGRDQLLVLINLAGFGVLLAGDLFLIPALGLPGAALMTVATPLFLIASRLAALAHGRDRAGDAEALAAEPAGTGTSLP